MEIKTKFKVEYKPSKNPWAKWVRELPVEEHRVYYCKLANSWREGYEQALKDVQNEKSNEK